jgi:hypothetical protein
VIARGRVGGGAERRPPERLDTVDQFARQVAGVIGDALDPGGSEQTDG